MLERIFQLPDLAEIGIQETLITPGQTEGVIFDAKKEKDLRHNKNLHGNGPLVEGLTGFYHQRYCHHGVHQPNKHRR